MTATANFSSARTGAEARHTEAPAANAAPFVLNLCSSTTPMALAQTDLPELKRFTFFVSRRFEEGRERFRLHMGYFATLAEAEEWLSVVREIYPGAWAGEAPGEVRRATGRARHRPQRETGVCRLERARGAGGARRCQRHRRDAHDARAGGAARDAAREQPALRHAGVEDARGSSPRGRRAAVRRACAWQHSDAQARRYSDTPGTH